MTSLDRSQLMVGTQLVYGDVHFDRGSDTTVGGGNGGNAAGLIPGGSFSYAQSVTPDFKLGFWSGSYFGGALQYDDGWSGRYYGTKAEIITLGAGINGAYRINDWLSIGGGPFALYGTLDQEVAINTLLEPGDGRLEFDDDDVGFGGMVGLMLEPWQGTRFGVTYISPVELDFKDDPDTSNLGPVLQLLLETRGLFERKIDLGLTVPQQVMVSAYHQLNQRLAIMGNVVMAGLERVRQARHLGRRHRHRQLRGRPRLRRHLGLRARRAVRLRRGLAVVGRRRLRHLADVEGRAQPEPAPRPAVPARHRHPVQLQPEDHDRRRLRIPERGRRRPRRRARAARRPA